MKITNWTQRTNLYLVRYITRPPAYKEFTLSQSFIFSYRLDGEFKKWTAPKGFTTDLASVPRIARWFASKTDAIEASVAHDWLYETASVPKDEADLVFLAAMEDDQLSPLRRRVMYQSVSWFGKGTYDD